MGKKVLAGSIWFAHLSVIVQPMWISFQLVCSWLDRHSNRKKYSKSSFLFFRVLDPFLAVSERWGDAVTLPRYVGRFAGRRQVATSRVSTISHSGPGKSTDFDVPFFISIFHFFPYVCVSVCVCVTQPSTTSLLSMPLIVRRSSWRMVINNTAAHKTCRISSVVRRVTNTSQKERKDGGRGGGPKRHKAWTTEHYAYRRDALELGEASRAIIGRWEMCRPGFIVSQLERKKKRGPNVTSTGWGFFFFFGKIPTRSPRLNSPSFKFLFCDLKKANFLFCCRG